MSRGTLKTFVVIVALAGPAFTPTIEAQDERRGVSQVHFVEPTAGAVLEWEEAFRKHVDWHRSKNDAWSWPVWEITTGERTGQFAVGTFFHHLQELERGELGAEDRDHALKNQGRYTESNTVEIWRYRPDVSNPPAYETVPGYAIVYYRHLNQGMMGTYSGAVRKINDAVTKANWGTAYYRNILVNSGEEPTAVRWVARPTWQSFAPPEKPFPKLLEEAYGKEEADAILDALNRSIHCGRSEIWTYRPDLSYTPGRK